MNNDNMTFHALQDCTNTVMQMFVHNFPLQSTFNMPQCHYACYNENN